MPTTRTGTCQAIDQIITWEQVREGDIVLHDGQLKMVDSIGTDDSQPTHLAVTFEGALPVWMLRTHRTAVTRYIETPADA